MGICQRLLRNPYFHIQCCDYVKNDDSSLGVFLIMLLKVEEGQKKMAKIADFPIIFVTCCLKNCNFPVCYFEAL